MHIYINVQNERNCRLASAAVEPAIAVLATELKTRRWHPEPARRSRQCNLPSSIQSGCRPPGPCHAVLFRRTALTAVLEPTGTSGRGSRRVVQRLRAAVPDRRRITPGTRPGRAVSPVRQLLLISLIPSDPASWRRSIACRIFPPAATRMIFPPAVSGDGYNPDVGQ